MPEKTKQFDIGDILTITMRRLVAERKIDAVYDILNWMTRDNLYVHQLPRARTECKPWLERWFPWTKGAMEKEVQWLSNMLAQTQVHDARDLILGWLIEVAARHTNGVRLFDVPRIPQDDHERIAPYDELVAMRGTDKGIVLVPPAGSEVDDG